MICITGVIERKVAEVFEPEVLSKKMTHWFAIVMGASSFVLMIPIVYRIWVGPTEFDRILESMPLESKTAVILVIIGTLFDCGICS